MADTKISALPGAVAATGGILAGVQSGSTVKFTLTSFGAALAEAASAAAQRTAMGLGTAATANTSAFDAAGAAAAAQAASQPLDADLTAIAALTSAADKVPYATGAGAWALADLTAAGRSMIGAATALAQAALIGFTSGVDVIGIQLAALGALASGGLIYGSAANTVGVLSPGSNGNVLTLAGGFPSWAAPAAFSIPDGTAGAPGLPLTNSATTGFYRVAADDLGISIAGVLAVNINASGITNALQYIGVANNTPANPSYSFTGDTNTGMFWAGADDLAFAVGGVQRIHVNTTAVTSTLAFSGPDGTAGAPTFRFTTSGTDGMYRIGTGNIGFATAGALVVDFSTTDLTSTLRWRGPNGTAALPGISFSGDTDTGIARLSSNQLDLVTGGTAKISMQASGTIFFNDNSGNEIFAVTSTLFESLVPIYAPVGSAGTPSYSINGDTNTGWYRVGSDDFGITTGGTLRFDISTTFLTSALPMTFTPAPTATANSGLINAGGGTFDGATGSFYVGPAAGTVLAMNTASTFAGDMINTQVAGNSVFKVTSVSGGNDGVQILAAASSTPIIQSFGTAGTVALTIKSKSTAALTMTSNAASLTLSSVSGSFSQTSKSAVSTTSFTFNFGDDTNLTTLRDVRSLVVDVARNVTHANGSYETQTDVQTNASTQQFVSVASVITNSISTCFIGSPNAGSNCTITNAHGVVVGGWNPNGSGSTSAALVAHAITGTVTNSNSLTAFVQTGPTNNIAVRLPSAPQASANTANLAIGSMAYDGTTSGFFTGSASGTQIGINAAAAFAGSYVDFQNNGVSTYKITTVASAVNGFTFTTSATGVGISLAATGTDTNIDFTVQSKGSGSLILQTLTTQKLGFYGAAPIVQGASVADATGGAIIDAEARTAINALITRIEATGLIATV